MQQKYRVVVVGAGKRGMHHALSFKANPRFEVVGLCDIDAARLSAGAERLGAVATDTDAARLVTATRPEVFCFCTLPNLRLDMVQLGIECGAKLLAFEKPVALSSKEGLEMRRRITGAGIRAVVSHQHRYGQHYRKVKEIVSSGELGRIQTIYASATGWMTHMLSHLIDYTRWYGGERKAEWVMAQASGRGKLSDVHASPDYITGVVHFEDGVHGLIECGAGAPDVPEVDYWWRKCRISVQGTAGFAEVLTGGGWRAVTKNGVSSGEGCMNYDLDMPPYIQDMANWLDNPSAVHPCNFESAYAGFEIMSAMIRSVYEGGQVALPLSIGQAELEQLSNFLPEKKVLLSMEANAKEYAAR